MAYDGGEVDPFEEVGELMIDEDEPRAGVLNDVLDVVRPKPRIDSADDRTRCQDAKIAICRVPLSGGASSWTACADVPAIMGELGAMTATRSPGRMPACMSAYARFCTLCAQTAKE